MIKVTTHYAKTNLSKLVAQVEAGEEVVICRGDTPVARLVAMAPEKRTTGVAEEAVAWGNMPPWDGKSPRQPGRLKGLIGSTPWEAFAPMTEEEIAEWEGTWGETE